MRVKVFRDNEIARVWECDDYEESVEKDAGVLYVVKAGEKTRACNLGDFGYGLWSYEIERN